jgi:hypothetical protein
MNYRHSIDRNQVTVTFDAKPADNIRAMLKAQGFRWSPGAGCWWRRGVRGAADFLAALDKRLNPGRPDGACWACNSPQGFFRANGPATPVYCDECWQRSRQPDPADVAYENACRDACGL